MKKAVLFGSALLDMFVKMTNQKLVVKTPKQQVKYGKKQVEN